MFSDRFSGIRGQERACKGKIGRENGEGNGNRKEEREMMAEVHLR